MQFPKTYRAVKDAEKGQWGIGEALIKEVGPPDPKDRTQAKRFAAAAKELAENGMPYSAEYLQRLRDVAAKFTSGRRGPDVSVEVARAAGTPEVLKAHRDTGKPMTKREVAKTRKAIRKATKTAKAAPTGTGTPTQRAISRERRALEFYNLATQAAKNAGKAAGMTSGWDEDEAEELHFAALEAANAWSKVADSLVRNRRKNLAVVGGR